MMTIYADTEITRRKRMHQIIDAQDETRWHGAKIVDCLQWLLDNDQRTALIVTDNRTLKISFQPHTG